MEARGTQTPTCAHHNAEGGCPACIARVRGRLPNFPVLLSHREKGPSSVPWSTAERAWEEYARRYGKSQSVERIAERGGFGLAELDSLFPGWRELAGEPGGAP